MTLVKFYPRNGQVKRQADNFLSYADLWNDSWMNDYYSQFSKSPKVNMIEENDRFDIELALPGISKKDIKIEVEKNVLTISGENSKDQDRKDSYARKEFDYTGFEKSFHIPDTINTDNIQAKMNDGILTISLPKRDDAIDKGPFNINID